jgi:hypothetical protein
MASYTQEMIDMIDRELKPIIAERDHYFDLCAKFEAALTAICAEVQDDGSLIKCGMIADTALTQSQSEAKHE